jgi:glutamate-5-semialdehyde dehydrogenase
MNNTTSIQAGDKIVVGKTILTVSHEFASSLEPGDEVLGVASTGALRRIPKAVSDLVDASVGKAVQAFNDLAHTSPEQVNDFFQTAAQLLSRTDVFDVIKTANDADVADARERGRSTTRLVLDGKMHRDMISAFEMWRSADVDRSVLVETTQHDGWMVEQYRAPLGVIGFVFEGRPNVFADATGVLKGGNTVVFRIGSDALGTARAIMDQVILPALKQSGLPKHCVELVDSSEHAAGWAMFSDSRLALAVARGSGSAVAELGSIAKQSGVSVSLHGTGGAWMILGEYADIDRVAAVVENSLDRKVCNTLNVVCVVKSRVDQLVPVVLAAAKRAADAKGTQPVIHCVGNHSDLTEDDNVIFGEDESDLAIEFEWETAPEFHMVVVDDTEQAVSLFNRHSPQFVVSVISENSAEQEQVWSGCNAPFVGDGFTRWVDGQFALLRPELGLSNWQNGRLFARSGVLSGDSAFTVRLKVSQQNTNLHR